MATMTAAERHNTMRQDLPRLENLDPQRVEILYDHQLDTLFVHLFGHDRRATNRLAGEHAYFRVDPETERIVGLQIEGFVRRAVKEYPSLIELLRYAELRGVSFDQVQRVSTSGFPTSMRWLLRIRTGLRLMLPSSTEHAARQAIAAVQLFAREKSNDAEVREEMDPQPR